MANKKINSVDQIKNAKIGDYIDAPINLFRVPQDKLRGFQADNVEKIDGMKKTLKPPTDNWQSTENQLQAIIAYIGTETVNDKTESCFIIETGVQRNGVLNLIWQEKISETHEQLKKEYREKNNLTPEDVLNDDVLDAIHEEAIKQVPAPCITAKLVEVPENQAESIFRQMIENVQRIEQRPAELGKALKAQIFAGKPISEIMERTGLSKQRIEKTISLTKLPIEIQEKINSKKSKGDKK